MLLPSLHPAPLPSQNKTKQRQRETPPSPKNNNNDDNGQTTSRRHDAVSVTLIRCPCPACLSIVTTSAAASAISILSSRSPSSLRPSLSSSAAATVCPVHLHGSTDLLEAMNSLNFVSSRVSPNSSPAPSRSNSLTSMGITVTSREETRTSDGDLSETSPFPADPDDYYTSRDSDLPSASSTERTPLLFPPESKDKDLRHSSWHAIPRRFVTALINSLRWVLSTLAAPGVYLVACFYNENGNFAPLQKLRKLFGASATTARKKTTDEKGDGTPAIETINIGHGTAMAAQPVRSSSSTSSGRSSESESDQDRGDSGSSRSGRRHSRARSLQNTEEISPSRRSIRIKLHNEEGLRQRKQKKSGSPRGGQTQKDISAQLKSPTSPIGALTKYPKTPAPPRPLIPRRQPSYINVEANGLAPQKTLILDLDETLIHSMSKGGRMSTGHMVEVKLNTTYVGVGGQASIGPQHPILYYVHKRPHCDDFLRRVSISPC